MKGFAAEVETFLWSCCLNMVPVLPLVSAQRINLANTALKQARCSAMGVVVLIMSYPVWYWKASVSSTPLIVV